LTGRAADDRRKREHRERQRRCDLQSGRRRERGGCLPTVHPSSITTVKGVAEPGTIRPSALPANCAHAIGNHPFEANAIRSTSHKQNELATSKRSTRAAKG